MGQYGTIHQRDRTESSCLGQTPAPLYHGFTLNGVVVPFYFSENGKGCKKGAHLTHSAIKGWAGQ